MLSLLATAATAVTAVMGSGTGVVDRPALLPVNHPSAWLETLANNVRDGNPEAAIEVLKERLGEHKDQAMKRPSQKTFKNKFKLQEFDNLNDLGSFALSDGTKTATVDGAGLDEDDQNVYYYTVSGWNADTTLEVGVSDDCDSFSTETGFFINSVNVFKEEASDVDEGGSWTSMVPACVLADVGDDPVYFYITVDSDTPQCTVNLTMTETAAPCNRVAVSGDDSGSIELSSDQWYWIDYSDTLTAGQLVSFSATSSDSFSFDAYAYNGNLISSTVEPFAVTKDYKAKWGLMSSGDNISITYTVTETPYTCADGAAIAAAATGEDAAFPVCNVDYNFVGYDADPFEGFLGLLLVFLPPACYEPTVAVACADLYPPCDSNNLVKTLCSSAICNGLVACANSLVDGTISGDDADAYCSSGDAGLNSYDYLGDENGTINSYPEYSTASGCAPVPLCATTCGVAALRPALMIMAFVVLNTVKNLYGN